MHMESSWSTSFYSIIGATELTPSEALLKHFALHGAEEKESPCHVENQFSRRCSLYIAMRQASYSIRWLYETITAFDKC